MTCNQKKIYNDYVEIDSGIWHEDSVLNFTFNIPLKDTIKYDISYHLRYDVSYPFYNIYISYYLEDSIGNSISSELQEIILFDKKSGEPLGDGLGEIFDLGVPSLRKISFTNSGEYNFKIKQFMRTNSLPGITSFGIEVNKTDDN